MRLYLSILLILIFCLATNRFAIAQTKDSTQVVISTESNTLPPDSSVIKAQLDSTNKASKKWSRPKKAMVWAMVLPGAGQVYNRKYWKLPILYGGAAALGILMARNQGGYSEFKSQYDTQFDNTQNNSTHTFVYSSSRTGSVYTTLSQLSAERDGYRRYRDLTVAGSLILYAISILDAYVDAHLREFDLSPDLSLRVNPLFYVNNNSTFVSGISLGFSLKNTKKSIGKLVY